MPDSAAPLVRIVIVDRSEAFRSGASGWIADQPGLEVVGTARSGPEGLRAVERLDPDLVLVDAVLPEMDGFQLVRTIKRRERPPLAVVTTFLPSTVARDAAYDAGADGFVAKDDFAGSFELLLDELLDGRGGDGRLTTRKRSVPRGSRIEPAR